MECHREILRPTLPPRLQGGRRKPTAAAKFADLKRQGAIVFGSVHPAKLHACRRGGIELEEFLERAGGNHAEFFAEFPEGTCIVVLARIQVAGRRGVPQSWEHVFGQGSLLHEDLAARVKHQDMRRPMAQAKAMNITTCFSANDRIARIDHVEYFVRHEGISGALDSK